ncbi:hypothetical protein CHLRE_07g354976v5 [Chlamydomonas reinhardtii]|uniref:Uncharacterized protein n=1 Tax=Chlamydomonas reinhardtii TaxID=3055 RepID=A0A2K3DLL6_CHLRE|nr:uncharacterized protein CHLRE_07g354976v5 [Chlamydomonas reinhardtii]PNW81413.1 hypothetical protein CHLRE_07g354976v5 [Chlamydomonas reinhardtii]
MAAVVKPEDSDPVLPGPLGSVAVKSPRAKLRARKTYKPHECPYCLQLPARTFCFYHARYCHLRRCRQRHELAEGSGQD